MVQQPEVKLWPKEGLAHAAGQSIWKKDGLDLLAAACTLMGLMQL